MPGHVFLVHGDLTRLACDAWLVPSRGYPRPGQFWEHAVHPDPPPGTLTSWGQVGGPVLPWKPLRPTHPRPWIERLLERLGLSAGNPPKGGAPHRGSSEQAGR